MRARTAIGLSPLALLLLPAGATAQSPVHLDFGWPTGTARVEVRTTSSSRSVDILSRERLRSYRMRVSEADGGLRISHDEHTFDGVPADELVEGTRAEGGPNVGRLLSLQPDLRVTSEGAFLGVENYDELRGRMQTALDAVRARMAAGRPVYVMTDTLMEAALTEDAVTRAAEHSWNQLAGWWAGRTLREGEPVTVSGIMELSNTYAPIEVDVELTLGGPVDCPEGADAEACLALESRSTPDLEEVRTLMDAFLADEMMRAGGGGLKRRVARVAVVAGATLIVDAATLRPFRIETRVEESFTMDSGGRPSTYVNTEVVTTRFDWGS